MVENELDGAVGTRGEGDASSNLNMSDEEGV